MAEISVAQVVEQMTLPLWQDSEYLQRLFGLLPVVIWITDLDLRITASFGGGLSVLGLRQNEAVGITIHEMFAMSNAEQAPIQAHEKALKGISAAYEIMLGELIFQVSVEPLFERDGQISGCVAIALDITTQKQTEELRRTLIKEQALSNLKTRLASMISFEFRTPLAVIQSSNELLQRYGDQMTSERKLEHEDTINNQVQQLSSLLDDIVTVSSDDLSRHNNPTQVDLAALCQGLISLVQVYAPLHQIRFTLVKTPCLVMIDAKLVQHALNNLLSNAIKYSPAGGGIEVNLSLEAKQAIISVQDNGIGITPEDQSSLFGLFRRGRNVGDIQGTGLGLSIVKRAVEIHGGTIECESQLGQGSTFTIRLPMTDCDDPDALARLESASNQDLMLPEMVMF
jgi:PAS domain S-box-containing protein